MRSFALAALPLVFVALAFPAFGQSEEAVVASIENIHGDYEGFSELYATMQDAFLFGDPTTIADLGIYPFEVEANGELYDIFEPEDLVTNFDTLVTEDTVAALGSQDFADLIVTSEGVGFADGALWVTRVCTDDSCAEAYWGITRINN